MKEIYCDNIFLHYMLKGKVEQMDKWALQLEHARNVGAKNAESFCKDTLNEYMRRVKIMLDAYKNRLQEEGV